MGLATSIHLMIVLETVRPVVERAKYVAIDDAAIQAWAEGVQTGSLRPPAHDLISCLAGSPEQLANLMLLIDSLNFCFWSDDPIRIEWRGRTYERFNAMFISLMLAARYDPRWMEASYWLEAPSGEIRQVLSGTGTLLMMEQREAIIRETGRVLLDRFDGQFTHAIESVNRRAWPLAVLLMANFDSFRDVSNYHGKPVYFMKRAQICAMDVSLAFESHGLAPLDGIEDLTAFADYRVPQALRHLGVLKLDAETARRGDALQELPRDSDEEIEIRAATIEAVQRMQTAVTQQGKAAAAWQVDWYLWLLSHDADVAVKHHRTRTVFY